MSEHQPTTATGYEAVPDALKERDQWLLWSKDSEPPKKPFNADGYGASWNDPDEWLTFEQANNLVETSDRFDGIGYVVAESDPFVLLDLDGCLRAPNEPKPKEWVRDIGGLEPLTDTWGQYSTSGTGMHVYIRGQSVPEWWTDAEIGEHEGIEVYQEKFAIVTGRTVEDFNDGITDIGKSAFRSFLFNAHTELNGDAPRLETDESNRSDDYDGEEWLTNDDVKDALSHISPDVEHGVWIQLAYAVHDYDSTSTGKRIFEGWSKSGSKYDDAAKRSIDAIWSDASAGAGVTVATLVHKAKANGWEPPATEAPSSGPKGGGSAGKTGLADALDSDWFDPDAQVVQVRPTADYSGAKLADLFRNPDDLPADVILAINEADGGDEYLNTPEEWTVEQAHGPPENYGVFAEWTVQQMKQEALRAFPTDRLRWVPEREEWFWCDDGGIWHQHGEENLRQWLDDYFGPHYRTHLFNEVRDQLKARTRASEQAFGGGPAGWIATESGLVNLETGAVRPIEPSDQVRWTLGTEYDPEAECPQWKEFIGDVAEPDDIPILQEFIGYCLHHWELPYKKALIIFGPTDAGKSVFLDVIQALFGGDESPATSSTSIQYLANERWGPARLVNTAVNIRNELSAETIQNAGKVKEIIAGDNLDAERKRKPVFKFAPTAKHLFAANRAPDRSTDDEAFWNRWLTVIFPESIPRQYQDPHLTDDLLAELPGILNWAIEGHRRLMDTGRFTNEPLPFQNRDKWERYGNSIEQWFTEYAEQEPDAVTPKWTTDAGTLGAYDSYKTFARRNGLEVETDQAFTAELKQREGISKRKLTVDGRQQQAYRGFQLTDRAPEPEHNDGDENPEDPQQAGLNV